MITRFVYVSSPFSRRTIRNVWLHLGTFLSTRADAQISKDPVPVNNLLTNTGTVFTRQSCTFERKRYERPGTLSLYPQWNKTVRSICSLSREEGVMDENWPEHEFSAVAEASLDRICDIISGIGYESENFREDFDAELSQGVLTVSLGRLGTYVLNTQTPNRQIWLSSPSSGPWRYAWNPRAYQWVSTRDGHYLADRLSEELSCVFDQNVTFPFTELEF